MSRVVLMLAAGLLAGPAASAQDAARADYFRAVAGYFSVSANEVLILSDWDISADEVPVVLFVARRSGVSPEAVVALRDSGHSWRALTSRFRVLPGALHVPIRDDAPAGALSTAYGRFRTVPVGEWSSIVLEDHEVVGLVNVRVISQALGVSAERVAAESGSTSTYVELYARFAR